MRATVMVAEDEAALRELLVLALRAHGFDTMAVGNSRDALAYLHAMKIDLILLDLGLGNENGIDLIKTLRGLEKARQIPVIPLTGRGDRNVVLEIAQLGIKEYVLKSQFSMNDLMVRINRQLSHRDHVAVPKSGHTLGAKSVNIESSANSNVSSNSIVAEGDHFDISPSDRTASPEGELEANSEIDSQSADLLRSLKPITTREQTIEQIDKCAELKALSPTVSQLMGMTGSSECSLEQIARVIKRDQAIALKVLKIANSVVYSRGESVDTVQKALSRIGTSQIRQLVLNISVIDNFHLNGLGENFSTDLFWEHSIATGLIAAAITRFRHGNDREIDSAFTMGLLHDVARIVFAEQLGDMYKRVLDTAIRLQLPLEQVESRMLVLNHADLMDRVLTAWQFPKSLVEPIAMHHLSLGNIRNLAPHNITEISTLALADKLAHAMLLGSSGNEALYPTDDLIQVLELSPEALEFIEKQIPEQTADMKLAMLHSSNGGKAAEYRKVALSKFKHPLRALYVCTNPSTDAYRIVFDQLRDPSSEMQPNVTILHIGDMRDRERLSSAAINYEKEKGLPPLPLIIITNSAAFKPDPQLAAGRLYKVLTRPFTISRLADTLNNLMPGDGN